MRAAPSHAALIPVFPQSRLSISLRPSASACNSNQAEADRPELIVTNAVYGSDFLSIQDDGKVILPEQSAGLRVCCCAANRKIIAEFHMMIRRRAAAELSPWIKRVRANLVASSA